MAASINYTAGGNLPVCTFAMALYGQDYQVKSADGTQQILGIVQEGSFSFPTTLGAFATNQNAQSVPYAAASGYPVALYQDEEHDECLLYVSAAVTGGQKLIADSSGNGYGIPWVPKTAASQYIGAEARESTAPYGVPTSSVPILIKVRPRFEITGTS